MRFPFKQTWAVARYISSRKREGAARFPLVLMLEPLHACNLSCSGCGRIREYRDQLSEMLPLSDCLGAADDCAAPVVSICGGEPLLYPEIKELVDGLIARGRVVYLCTNGQALEKKLSLFTPSKLFNINVHLDGPAKTHDAIVEHEGAFDKAVEGIKAAKDAGFTVCTNTTVYRHTDMGEVRGFLNHLDGLGIDGILLSPGFDYTDVEDRSVFLTRDEIVKKFGELKPATRRKSMWSTPIYLDFLAGHRELTCTPWGNVTYNVKGWKAPCYLITDGHYAAYDEFMNEVEWDRYGPGLDQRCSNCMVHSGFEATVALETSSSIRDVLRMTRWTLF